MKKFLISIWLLISAVLVGAFFVLKDWWNPLNEKKEEIVGVISTTEETQSREEIVKRFDVYNKAIETGDDNLCNSLVWDEAMKTRCSEEIIIAKVGKEMNISLCDKIKDSNTILTCKNNFFHKQALLSKDQTLCDSIVWDSGLMNICRTDIVGWVKKEDKNPDMEILAETMKTNDIKSCTSVSTKELQTKCKNEI